MLINTIGETSMLSFCIIKMGTFRRGSPMMKQNPFKTFFPICGLSFLNNNNKTPIPKKTSPMY
jgi:hypothetical protein